MLRIVHDKFSIDGLGPTEIAKILTEKFRLRSTRQAVQKALDGARDYVDRVTKKGRTVYRIMHTGEQYLDSGEYQTSKRRVPRPSGKRGRAKISKSKHPSKDKAESIAIKKKTSGGRPGPRTALNQLVGEGFFDSPQRIIDIKKHLAQTKAHNYKATDLSPTLARMLRDGILDRNRAEDGQYEYQRK